MATAKAALKTSFSRTPEARLFKCARRAGPSGQWCEATDVIDVTDPAAAIWGVGSEVYFDRAKKAPKGHDGVFLHRRRRRAIVGRVVKRNGDCWIVDRYNFRGTRRRSVQLDGETWCGGYRVLAIMLPAAKRLRSTALNRA